SRSAADVRHLYFADFPGRRSAQLGVTVSAYAPDRSDTLRDLSVRGAAAQQAAEIGAAGREQTGVQLALGRQARTRAIAAESLRYRRDETDFTGAVAVAPALGHLTAIIRVDWFDTHFLVDELRDLARRYNVFHPPVVGRADIHVFDEPQYAS